jgi:hypothetical protein
MLNLSPGKKIPVPFFDSLKCGTIIRFDTRPGRGDHLAAWNDHYIYAIQRFTGSEKLSNPAFRPVANDRVPDLLAGGDAQTWRRQPVGQGETGHEPAAQPDALLVDPGVLGPPAQFLVRHAYRPGKGRTHQRLLLGRNREALAAFGAAALENDAPVLCMHAHQESMGLTAALPVGLKRTFHRKSLGKRENCNGRTYNPTGRVGTVSTNHRVKRHCATVRACFREPAPGVRESDCQHGIWSPPKVFHTCAKTCGNCTCSDHVHAKKACFTRLFGGESPRSTI